MKELEAQLNDPKRKQNIWVFNQSVEVKCTDE